MKAVVLFALVLSFLSCQSPESGKQATAEQPDFSAKNKSLGLQALLDSLNLTGTILLYNEATSTYTSNDHDRANTGQLPASTFKITNTIIALETGVASGPEHIFRLDGTDRWLDAWERDLNLQEAFAASCVPCYQEVARAVGEERMRTELDRIGYTGMVFDSATVDNFWLGGESRITPYEQIQFLRRLYHAALPVKASTQAAIRDIMVREKTENYVLSGKTGWSIVGEQNNGWFVGFVERSGEVNFFATNVEPGPGFDVERFPAARITATRLALNMLGVI